MVVTKKLVIARKYLEKLSFLFKSYCAVRTIYTQSGSCHFHVEIRKYIEFENLDKEGYLYKVFFYKTGMKQMLNTNTTAQVKYSL